MCGSGSVLLGTLGTACRRAFVLAIATSTVLLGGCSATKASPSSEAASAAIETPVDATVQATLTPELTRTPSPAATALPAPTPLPTPRRIVKIDLMRACAGNAVEHAPAYEGRIHPLVIAVMPEAGGSGLDLGHPFNDRWTEGRWPGPIQLVMCVEEREPKSSKECPGTYKSAGLRYLVTICQQRVTAKVVVLRTGEVLEKRTVLGSKPKCRKTMTPTVLTGPTGTLALDFTPLYGARVIGSFPEAKITEYATLLSGLKGD